MRASRILSRSLSEAVTARVIGNGGAAVILMTGAIDVADVRERLETPRRRPRSSTASPRPVVPAPAPAGRLRAAEVVEPARDDAFELRGEDERDVCRWEDSVAFEVSVAVEAEVAAAVRWVGSWCRSG